MNEKNFYDLIDQLTTNDDFVKTAEINTYEKSENRIIYVDDNGIECKLDGPPYLDGYR